MEFGFGKCAQVTINRGKLTTSKNFNLSLGKQLRQLEIGEAYKYLGIQQSSTNHSKVVKTTTMTEYNRRVRAILKSKLSGGNQISAINTYAVPVVTYTAGIIDWTKEELRQMDTKTRKKMTIYKALHPRADVDRLYLARKKGGRGLLSVENMVNLEKTSLAEYAYNSPEPVMKILIDEGLVKFTMPTDKKKREIQGERDERWRNKAIHGKWAEIVDKTDPKTSQWLRTSHLKPVTEALLTAAQDQALNTNWHAYNILKTRQDDKCKTCIKHPETVEHIVAGCPMIAQTLYLKRHNAVAATVHWGLCKTAGFERADNWWKHSPEAALENENYKMLYDFNIITDRKISARRPDIVFIDKKNNNAKLIDISCPADRNAEKKRTKRLKNTKS